jgi:hypothetical protein
MVSPQQLLAFLVTCFGFSSVACAHPNAYGGYRVSVQDDLGRELPTFQHGAQSFVLGSYGERYNIRVENRTGRRVEAVVTVDGRDVVSGRVGDYVGERGYLIDPHDQVLIEGFRESFEQVAAFRFVTPGQSYSSRMGTPQNVGVIGVAIFPERVVPRPAPRTLAPRERIRPEASRRYDEPNRGYGTSGPSGGGGDDLLYGLGEESASPSPSASADASERRTKGRSASAEAYEAPAPSRDNLGTEYGESVTSSVREVSFQRANSRTPAAVLTLRYDDRAGLQARGIAIDPPYRRCEPYTYSQPSAFPRNRRFAPPPPND